VIELTCHHDDERSDNRYDAVIAGFGGPRNRE
jgi:hypothetical protein